MQGDKGRGWCNNLISNRKLQKPEAKCQAPSNYMEGAWHFALINFSSPWLIQEIEPNAAAVIGTFGIKTEALMDVIRGKFNPTGKLPLTIPANQEAVTNEKGDVPGFDEAPSYVYRAKSGDKYGYGFGLSYNMENKKTKSGGIGEFLRNIFKK